MPTNEQVINDVMSDAEREANIEAHLSGKIRAFEKFLEDKYDDYYTLSEEKKRQTREQELEEGAKAWAEIQGDY